MTGGKEIRANGERTQEGETDFARKRAGSETAKSNRSYGEAAAFPSAEFPHSPLSAFALKSITPFCPLLPVRITAVLQRQWSLFSCGAATPRFFNSSWQLCDR